MYGSHKSQATTLKPTLKERFFEINKILMLNNIERIFMHGYG